MALVGFELIAVAVILLILFLWGPQKLPEIAKSIGLARREFGKATKEVASVSTSTISPASAEEPIIVAAKALGMKTEGKTKEDLAKEIAELSQSRSD